MYFSRRGTFRSMRYVVKHKQTGCYLRSTGEWTSSLNEAERFPNGLSVPLHLESQSGCKVDRDVEVLRLSVE